MSVRIPISFPTLSPPHHLRRRTSTVIRFSRWNNANADPFNRRLRTQQQIEYDLRRSRRFRSADRIISAADDDDHGSLSSSPLRRPSLGTPSFPSRSSIPGRKSKYSKNPNPRRADVDSYGRQQRRGSDLARNTLSGDDDPAANGGVGGLVGERRRPRQLGDDDVAERDKKRDADVAERGKRRDADVAEDAPPEGSRRYGNGFRDDDVAPDGRFRDGYADVASKYRRFRDDDVARNRLSGSSVGERGGDADVAKNRRFRDDDVAGDRRFRGSVGAGDADVASEGRSGSAGDADVAANRRGADVASSGRFANMKPSHPAFRRFRNSVKKKEEDSNKGGGGVKVLEDGVSYMVGGAPFEFMYSYTETPKVKPLRLREPPVAPFGPSTMDRPWTGRKPLAKKKLPEFDSFKLPSPHKKGVKPVQSPGPFLPGSGPKYVHSREEILGEPLSKTEIKELVNGCRKSRRQMHMGRDGLTHNMLENIHAHWKRRRLCKIKCLGVCTVDMDNVRQQLEEKTGGKVIYGSGGVIYLFRGRNYNYMTRPRYPLMLWKPVTPVYPRLVQRVPDGLTLEETSTMRKKGRNLIPICKLGKNGVYSNLVKDVREAFEACDIVRINCQGLNSSDYHKIGAKLKDLVPCVLLSFEREHILMWRGKEWTSSLPKLGEATQIENSEFEVTLSSTSDSEDEGIATSFFSDSEDEKEEIVEVEGLITEEDSSTSSNVLDSFSETNVVNENEISNIVDDHVRNNIELTSLWAKGVQLLLKEAIDNGAAVILDNSNLDSDNVFQTALSLAKSAPRGPVFKDRRRKTVVKKSEKEKTEDLKVEEVLMIEDDNRKSATKNSYRREMVLESVKADYTDVVPQGSLRVDELAKLLA